jgi:hypothetical protein
MFLLGHLDKTKPRRTQGQIPLLLYDVVSLTVYMIRKKEVPQ